MVWVVGAGVLVGLLMTALGTAAIRTGWTPPWTRRHVTRPRVYGLGALLAGMACVVQGLFCFRLVPGLPEATGFPGTVVLLLIGLALIGAGQMLPARRGD